jgi:parvulin-like peptidyl-prolyl isomerase
MSIKIISTLYFLFWLLPGISAGEVIDRIVAKVNDDIITLSELEKLVYSEAKVNTGTESEKRRIFNKEKKNVLNKIIEQKLLLHYAKLNRLEATKNDIDNAIEDIKMNNNFSDEVLQAALEREGMTMKIYRTSLKQQITLSKVLNAKVRSRIKINEKDAESYYSKNKKKFLKPVEIKAYHIIFVINNKEDKVKTAKQKKKALRVLKLARKGEEFEELARTHSEGPSKDTGGDLGWVKKGAMIPSFEKAAFSLRKGEISSLVKTDYGYHIIKVVDRREAKNRTLDEARDKIKKILFKNKYDNKYDKWMAELKKNAFIEVYLAKESNKKRYTSLNTKKKHRRIRGDNPGSSEKIRKKTKIKKKQNAKTNSKPTNSKDKIKISKFILRWEKARETKNRRRYFSFYSEDFKTNELSLKEWKKITEKEYEKYKFIDIEIRDFRVFRRDSFYVAAFDQRIKSNVIDNIRMVRLYLTKKKGEFKIASEKWLNSPDTHKEFFQKPLLSYDTLPKFPSKLPRKKRR